MSPIPLSILTWNINFRSAASLDALANLAELPDIVTLQEVVLKRAAEVQSRLRDLGYAGVIYSGDESASNKRYGNVIATRMPIKSLSLLDAGFPWPQLIAHGLLDTPAGQIHVVNAHVPNGSGNGWKKIHTLRSLSRLIEGLRSQPLILAGDFNEPRYALQDDHVVTWGQILGRDAKWRLRSKRTLEGESGTGEEWDAVVRWFFEKSDESGIRNAYWEVAGHGKMEPSHLSRGCHRWFDHVFVSNNFKVKSCKFLHAFREDGFSDHSALHAELSHVSG